MEQKVIEKIHDAIELVNEKIDNNNKALKLLYEEVFTKEVMQMIKTIDVKYYHFISDDRLLYIDPSDTRIRITDLTYGVVTDFEIPKLAQPWQMMEAYYDNWGIGKIEQATKRALAHEKYLNAINKLAPEIIDDITNQYREVTEEQEGRLDDVLKMLNVDVTPVKRIKVTIEWV